MQKYYWPIKINLSEAFVFWKWWKWVIFPAILNFYIVSD